MAPRSSYTLCSSWTTCMIDPQQVRLARIELPAHASGNAALMPVAALGIAGTLKESVTGEFQVKRAARNSQDLCSLSLVSIDGIEGAQDGSLFRIFHAEPLFLAPTAFIVAL